MIKEGNLYAELEKPFGSFYTIWFTIHVDREKYVDYEKDEPKNVFEVIIFSVSTWASLKESKRYTSENFLIEIPPFR